MLTLQLVTHRDNAQGQPSMYIKATPVLEAPLSSPYPPHRCSCTKASDAVVLNEPTALFTVERAETACGTSTSLLDRRGGTTAETPPHVLAGNQLAVAFSLLYAEACLLTTAFEHVVQLGMCC